MDCRYEVDEYVYSEEDVHKPLKDLCEDPISFDNKGDLEWYEYGCVQEEHYDYDVPDHLEF